MASGDIDLVRGHYAAMNRGDFEAAEAGFAAEVVLITHEAAPDAGTYRGRDRVAGWFGDWFRTFGWEIHFDLELIEQVADAVVVLARHTGRGRASGAEAGMQVACAYWIRDGEIVRLAMYEDLGDARTAAAGQGPS